MQCLVWIVVGGQESGNARLLCGFIPGGFIPFAPLHLPHFTTSTRARVVAELNTERASLWCFLITGGSLVPL
jgi:hypothetical protein